MRLGDKIWHRGEQVVIASLPYTRWGKQCVVAVNESGSTVSVSIDEHPEQDKNGLITNK